MAEVPQKKKKPLKGRGGLVMTAVLALLGGVFFWDQKTPVRDPDSNPPVSDYVHATAPDVSRIEMKRSSDPFVLARRDGKWWLESPIQARADTQKVDDWLKGILDASVSQKIDQKVTDAAAYGLDKPAAELVLTTRRGQRTLQLGKDFRTPGSTEAGSVYYFREVKDGRLFMLGSFQAEEVRAKKIDDLRDKHLVEIAEEKDVRKIRIERAAGPLEVERKGDKWELLQPFRAPADKMDVESLVTQLRTSEADSFATENAADLAQYGLDQPRVTVRVTDRKGEHVVHFGKAAPDGKVYAAREGEKVVALVAKTTFDSLDKKPADLRDRQLISLESDRITFVQLQNAHGTVKLQKTGSDWQIAGAPAKENKAKADMVQQVINAVRGSAFKHVEEGPRDLAKYGLDKPQITVQVNAGAGTSQVFALGKETEDGNYYARGTPNAVFQVMNYVFADLNVKPDAFKEAAEKK